MHKNNGYTYRVTKVIDLERKDYEIEHAHAIGISKYWTMAQP